MANQLGPIEILCDAPPYPIVRACSRIGIQSPEDVRWCRISRMHHEASGWRGFLQAHPWKLLLGGGKWGGKPCSCHEQLPPMGKHTFTYVTGNEATYVIGQCPRCRTVYWEEA